MVQTNQNPWKETSNRLISSTSKTQGSGAAIHQNFAYALQNNANNILKLAMTWVVTGDISFGIIAMNRLNEWSVYRSGGDCLRQGIGSSNLVSAAEIIRYASVNGTTINWPAEQIAAFEDMLTNYMMTTLDTLRTNGDGGWGTPAINAITSIGVFCNNATIYDKGINLFKYGAKKVYLDATACNGVLEMIDPQGICSDSGRDQPHAQGIIAHLFDVAITSWNQGTEDLFSYGNNRLLLGVEYAAKYNLGEDVPYTQQYDCNGNKKWGKHSCSYKKTHFGTMTVSFSIFRHNDFTNKSRRI
jgi:hypothetical protein